MTGLRYAGFFNKQILGKSFLEDFLFGHAQAALDDVVLNVIGSGVLDPTGSGSGLGLSVDAEALNDRRFTVTGSKAAFAADGSGITAGSSIASLTDTEGSRTIFKQNGAWFSSLPFENKNATTYYVFLHATSYPTDVSVGRDLSLGYANYCSVPGVTINPNSVVDGGSALKLHINTNLETAFSHPQWLTSNTDDTDWSWDVIVWLDDDQTSIATSDPDVAVAFGKLVKDGVTNKWSIDLTGLGDGYLGQATPSTTAADYKVCILGPVLTTDFATFDADAEYVFVGSILSGGSETLDVTGQSVIPSLRSAGTGFGVEHEQDVTSGDFGRHNSVTAPATSDLIIGVDDNSTKTVYISNLDGGGSAKANLQIQDDLQVQKWTPKTSTSDVSMEFNDAANDRTLDVRNVGSGKKAILAAGELQAVKTNNGSGDVVSNNLFSYGSAPAVQEAVIDAIRIKTAADTHATGTGIVTYDSGGSEADNIYLASDVNGSRTILVPIYPGVGFSISQIRLYAYMDAAGTPQARVYISYWDETATGVTDVIGPLDSTASGAWNADTFAAPGDFTAHSVTNPANRQYYLKLVITNNGTANDTARISKVKIGGTPTAVHDFI